MKQWVLAEAKDRSHIHDCKITNYDDDDDDDDNDGDEIGVSSEDKDKSNKSGLSMQPSCAPRARPREGNIRNKPFDIII